MPGEEHSVCRRGIDRRHNLNLWVIIRHNIHVKHIRRRPKTIVTDSIIMVVKRL